MLPNGTTFGSILVSSHELFQPCTMAARFSTARHSACRTCGTIRPSHVSVAKAHPSTVASIWLSSS